MNDPVENAFEEGFTGKPVVAPPADSEGVAAQFPMQPRVEPKYESALKNIAARWPSVASHLNSFVVRDGDAAVGNNANRGYMEFIPAWDNTTGPHPGRPIIEVYDKSLAGKRLENMIAGDTLHHLGAIDPRTGTAIDPGYQKMKQELIASRTPGQNASDQQVYQKDKANFPDETGPFDDWMNTSRADAYIRGRITPDSNDNWRDFYTPAQHEILDRMQAYLESRAK